MSHPMTTALARDWLFRAGLVTAVHTHEQGIISPDCPGCLEEQVRWGDHPKRFPHPRS